MKSKHTGKVLVSCVILLGGLVGAIRADEYNILCNGDGVPQTFIQAVQTDGAKEPGTGNDGKDSFFMKAPSYTAIDFYLRNVDGDYSGDSRGPDSTSDFYARIEGRGISGSINANLVTQIWDPSGEGSFDWKNLVIELYNSGDVNIPANKIETYDGHDLADGTTSFQALTIQNGLCYQLLIKPRHYADLDFNQEINFKDFAYIGLFWKREDANSVNFWNDYSDIDRNTITDFNDLSYISSDWLWTQDPNLM